MSFTTKKPPTLEGLEAAVNAQTETLHRMLRLQAMQGEMLSEDSGSGHPAARVGGEPA